MPSGARKLLVTLAAALLWPYATAHGGDDSFYQGPAVIRRVSGTIDLQREESPVAQLEVEVQNTSRQRSLSGVKVGFRGYDPVPVSLGRNEAKTVTLTPTKDLAADPGGVRQARLDLVLEIDGRLPNKPIDDTDLLILLPPGVPALIRSNVPLVTAQPYQSGPGRKPTPRRHVVDRLPTAHRARRAGYAKEEVLPEPGRVQDRAAYRLVLKRKYLTELNLIYNVESVSLSITKSISPTVIDKARLVRVTLKMCNWGPDPATPVVLSDNFDPRDFAGVTLTGGTGTFQNYAGTENDRRLLWTYTVPGVVPLCSTGSMSVAYYVLPLLSVRNSWLNAATGVIGAKLVGVSNKIRLGP